MLEAPVGIVDAGVGVTVLPELTVRLRSPRQAAGVRPFVGPKPMREVSVVYAREQARAQLTSSISFDVACRPCDGKVGREGIEAPAPERTWFTIRSSHPVSASDPSRARVRAPCRTA